MYTHTHVNLTHSIGLIMRSLTNAYLYLHICSLIHSLIYIHIHTYISCLMCNMVEENSYICTLNIWKLKMGFLHGTYDCINFFENLFENLNMEEEKKQQWWQRKFVVFVFDDEEKALSIEHTCIFFIPIQILNFCLCISFYF